MIKRLTRVARLEIVIKEECGRQGLLADFVRVIDVLPHQNSHCERTYRLAGLA